MFSDKVIFEDIITNKKISVSAKRFRELRDEAIQRMIKEEYEKQYG
jgi:hypothetical protein